MTDDLTRRAIIAVHDAECVCGNDPPATRELSPGEAAIVEKWRTDIAKVRQNERALFTRAERAEAERDEYREGYESWRDSGRRMARVLLDIWHTKHMTYGDGPSTVYDSVRRALNEAEAEWDNHQIERTSLREAVRRLDRLRTMTLDSDGVEYPHNHPDTDIHSGELECPACWAERICAVLDGIGGQTDEERGGDTDD